MEVVVDAEMIQIQGLHGNLHIYVHVDVWLLGKPPTLMKSMQSHVYVHVHLLYVHQGFTYHVHVHVIHMHACMHMRSYVTAIHMQVYTPSKKMLDVLYVSQQQAEHVFNC